MADASAAHGDWHTFDTTVRPFISKHCLDCHDETNKGDVRLDRFADESSLVKELATIDRAAGMLRKHAMPPRKKSQPSEEEVAPVLGWMNAFIARMDRELPPNPGRMVIRRLNRAEYNNTVRDLLGVDFHPADDFPPDDTGFGFDNIGATLSMNPTLMEKYLAAAEKEKAQATAKLGNEAFLAKAPDHVVDKIRGRLAKAEDDIARLAAQLERLPQA